jgi:hypothetical protein
MILPVGLNSNAPQINQQQRPEPESHAPAAVAPRVESPTRAFVFATDTFAFPNELVWQYRLDPASGRMRTCRNDPPPTYAHRCFVLVRAARQFFYHARFAPELPESERALYRALIRRVLSRDPRRASPDADRVTVPGFSSLRAFSQSHETLLKSICGGAWRSYFLRSHWRMVFPISRRHQEQTARRLLLTPTVRMDPIVHLVRFPQLTINHGLTLFARADFASEVRFQAYDPNVPDRPAELVYDRTRRTFFFPPNHYWAGGRVDVIEIYRGGLY